MIFLSIPFNDSHFVREQTQKYSYYSREYRLDYNPNFIFFPQELIDENTILTIRSPLEGGKKNIRSLDKLYFLTKMARKHNCLIDVEYNTYIKFPQSIFPESNTILSYHDFSEISNENEIKNLFQKVQDLPVKYFKIAVNISRYSLLLELERLIKSSNKKVLLAGLGKLGKLSRLIYKQMGAFGTYVGLPENLTAEAQLTITEAKQYDLQNRDADTKIGGIVGEKQIFDSRGLQFYNEYFKKNSINAIYLPFWVKKIADFKKWLAGSNLDLYGFSVTMPYKKSFNDIYNKLGVINLLLPVLKESKNTDLYAFEKALEYLRMKNSDSVLILGTGATAETALRACKDFKSVKIKGRNIETGESLAKSFNREYRKINDMENKKYELIINCTPVCSGEIDLFSQFYLKPPDKFIDLPYADMENATIKKCRKENIEYVDGQNFWIWQAEIQQDYFLQEIDLITNRKE